MSILRQLTREQLCTSIIRFGPIVRGWTMRFEARHRHFKQLALQLGNFINIPFTLAMRHQKLQCYHQLSDTLEGEEVDIGPGPHDTGRGG